MGHTDASDRVDALVTRIEQLEAEVRGLKGGSEPGLVGAAVAADEPVSRRRLIGMAGAAAAGAAGVALATAAPASATTGNWQFGVDTSDAGIDDTALTSANTGRTLRIFNTGGGHGIQSETDSTGSGFTGITGAATASTGTTFGVSGTTASTGTFGNAGVRGIASAATGLSHGVWGKTSSVNANAAGVFGEATAITGATFGMKGTNVSTSNGAVGVRGEANGTTGVTTGVHGTTASTTGNGVRGSSSGILGTGVLGTALGGPGVSGLSDTGSSIVAQAPTLPNSGGAHLTLLTASFAGPPTGGAHTLGDFFMDQQGALWQCTVGGTPGKWVRQSPLTLLASPFRVYDSRAGQPNPSGSPQGGLAFGVERSINCVPALPSGISSATGLLMNVTLANTVGPKGAVTVYSAAVAAPLTSSVNWAAANTNIANAVTSACDTLVNIKVKCVSGTSTQFIVDVVGYYP